MTIINNFFKNTINPTTKAVVTKTKTIGPILQELLDEIKADDCIIPLFKREAKPIKLNDIHREYTYTIDGHQILPTKLFHATSSQENLDKIRKNGFDILHRTSGREEAWGHGAYFNLAKKGFLRAKVIGEFKLNPKKIDLKRIGFINLEINPYPDKKFTELFEDRIRGLARKVGLKHNLAEEKIINLGNEAINEIISRDFDALFIQSKRGDQIVNVYKPDIIDAIKPSKRKF